MRTMWNRLASSSEARDSSGRQNAGERRVGRRRERLRKSGSGEQSATVVQSVRRSGLSDSLCEPVHALVQALAWSTQ